MTPLLLLIDLQAGFLAAAGLQPAAGRIVERAGALLAGCRAAGVPIVHVWTTVSRADDRRMPHWKRAGTWTCEEGTPGHAPPPSLRPAAGEPVVHKSFFSAFSGGALAALLQERGADTLLVAGVHLHGCVRQTVLDAYERGHAVWVAEDAVGSDDPLHAAITWRYLEERAARFAPVADLQRLLAAGGIPSLDEGEAAAPGEGGEDPDVRAAAARARSAWPEWAESPLRARRAVLERLVEELERRRSDLAEQMALAIGKPIASGAEEVRQSAAMVRAVARQGIGRQGLAVAPSAHRSPLGVVAVVTPWNNPFLIPAGKIAAALHFGNTVVWKPAPAAAALAAELMVCLRAAGCPEGTVNLLPGGRRRARALMADPGIGAVTLTGGAAAGWAAQEICARRQIPLQAELGGNNAALVWRDAELVQAATRIAEGAFGQAGQRCTANRRAVVHRDCHSRFLEELLRAVAALPWGSPLDASTVVGPLVSPAERGRVAALVARAVAQGAEIFAPHGSERPAGVGAGDAGAYHPPTVILSEDPGCEIVQEETFGPVLVVQQAGSWDEAVGLCNGVRQGLAAAIFTASRRLQRRFLQEAQAGVVKINQSTAGAAAHLPFGGWKASGIGPPEHGAADREFYARLQSVYPPPPAE